MRYTITYPSCPLKVCQMSPNTIIEAMLQREGTSKRTTRYTQDILKMKKREMERRVGKAIKGKSKSKMLTQRCAKKPRRISSRIIETAREGSGWRIQYNAVLYDLYENQLRCPSRS